jgi:hypothetical protein
MPRKIVPETRPIETQPSCVPAQPKWKLSKRDVERFSKEWTKYMKQFAPAFPRVEQAKHSEVYTYTIRRYRCIQGLLGNATRKNVEQMALGLGKKVSSLQHFIGQSSWAWEGITAIHQGLIGESLGEEDGVDALGKWYFTEIKATTPLWRTRPRVYVPTWKGKGPHPTHLRLRNPNQHPIPVKELIRKIPRQDWVPAVIKEGSKGPLACEFAFLRVTESRTNLPVADLWLIVRRNLDDPSIVKYYFSNAPSTTPPNEFIRLSGMRWPIETIFEEAKGEVGLDHYTCTNRTLAPGASAGGCGAKCDPGWDGTIICCWLPWLIISSCG